MSEKVLVQAVKVVGSDSLPSSVCNLSSSSLFRARLHGKFQPGLKFQPGWPGWNFVAITWWTSARAEILVSAPNMKFRAKSLGRIRQPYYFLLFSPGWNFFSITWDFFSPGRISARAENPSPVWSNRARIFNPGWISPRAEKISM